MENAVSARDDLAQEISVYWDARAESYSNGVCGELADGRGDAWRSKLEDLIDAHLGMQRADGRVLRALDLGCGPGFFEILLARMDCTVDAVDGSEEMLARARKNTQDAGVVDAVTFHQSDVCTLPFEDSAFDLVVSRNLTWLMRDPEAAYAEWLRVLRPGGMLAVFDANWYLYRVNEEIDRKRIADQKGDSLDWWDPSARATTAEEQECELIADKLPLTPIVRPAWDVDVLTRMGVSSIETDENAWRQLWGDGEKAFYGSSPMFSVVAVK